MDSFPPPAVNNRATSWDGPDGVSTDIGYSGGGGGGAVGQAKMYGSAPLATVVPQYEYEEGFQSQSAPINPRYQHQQAYVQPQTQPHMLHYQRQEQGLSASSAPLPLNPNYIAERGQY